MSRQDVYLCAVNLERPQFSWNSARVLLLKGRPSHASEDRAGRECSAVDTPGYPESLHCSGDCTAHRRSSTVEQRHMKGRTAEMEMGQHRIEDLLDH